MLTEEQLFRAWGAGKMSDRYFLASFLGPHVFNAASAFTRQELTESEWRRQQDATEGNWE